MEIKKYGFFDKIQHFLFGLVILCIPFQDFGLQNTVLGDLGRYLSNLPLILAVLFSFIKLFCNTRYNKKDLYYCTSMVIYMICYSLIVLIEFINDTYFDLYFYKIFTNLVITCLWGYMYIYIKYNEMNFKIYIIGAYVVHISGWILHDILKLNLGSILRATENLISERYSGFLSEASVFCFTTIVLGFLTVYYIKNKLIKYLIILLSVIISLLGGSKGTIICLGISVILIILLLKNINIIFKLIFSIIMLYAIVNGIYYLVMDSFINDLENYASFATRVSSILSVGFILIKYPFGTGFGAFLPVYQSILYNSFDFVNNIIPNFSLNYNEITTLVLSKDGKGVTIKNIIFQYIAYFGLPFIIMLYRYFKFNLKYLINNNNYYLLFCFLFVSLGIITYANIGYAVILMLGIISNNNRRNNI